MEKSLIKMNIGTCKATRSSSVSSDSPIYSYEIQASAQKRKEAHAYSQVFHLPADENDKNPPLPKLLLDHDVVFHLKEKVFSLGGANLTGT